MLSYECCTACHALSFMPYLPARLESVPLVLTGGGALEDMLDNEEQLAEQLDALPYLVGYVQGLVLHGASCGAQMCDST
jgi:hypothetical protein